MTSSNETSISLSNAFVQFLRTEKAQTSSAQFAATSQTLHLFSTFLRDRYKLSIHHVQSDKISASWGREFLRFLQETRSVETEHLYSRAILQFYSYIQRNYASDIDTDNLSQFIINNRRTKSHTIPHIPSDALQAIRAYAQTYTPPNHLEHGSRLYLQHLRDKAFILTLYDTGLRISEICELRIRQLDLASAHIHPTPTMQLPLSSTATVALRTYLNDCNSAPNFPRRTEHAPIFARHDKRAGTRLLQISRWTAANIVTYWAVQALPQATREALETNSQAITANTFRHYFVQRTLTNDLSITQAQALARHQDIGTTRRYLKTLPEQTDE